MELDDFQSRAVRTDITGHSLVALLGLAGEIGGLHSVFKKKIRDKPTKEQFKAELSEELGDTLWYLATLASLNNIKLSDIAAASLTKTEEFFGIAEAPFFDEGYPENEQFPAHMRIEFEVRDDGRVRMIYNGNYLGDSLFDNAHVEDNYKFHDAFHLAFLAHLHWSPNIRRLLKRKRKSQKHIDENEDGARACAVEEAAAALAFGHAREANFYPSIDVVPLKLVNLLTRMTSNFEVKGCRSSSWRKAIHDGSQAFSRLSKNSGGVIEIDLPSSTMTWE